MKINKIIYPAAVFILAIFSLLFAQDETVTITTYYPSPAGSYNELGVNKLAVDVTGVAVTTEYAAMQNGDAHIGRSLIIGTGGGSGFAYDEMAAPDRPQDGDLLVKGDVGVGTNAPRAKLDVAGGLKIGDDADCNAQKAGTLRYNGGTIQYCDDTGVWKNIAGGGAFGGGFEARYDGWGNLWSCPHANTFPGTGGCFCPPGFREQKIHTHVPQQESVVCFRS